VLPFGKLVPAPESCEGQIQFQNLVAMWLSRRRDNRKYLSLAGFGTNYLLIFNNCLVWFAELFLLTISIWVTKSAS